MSCMTALIKVWSILVQGFSYRTNCIVQHFSSTAMFRMSFQKSVNIVAKTLLSKVTELLEPIPTLLGQDRVRPGQHVRPLQGCPTAMVQTFLNMWSIGLHMKLWFTSLKFWCVTEALKYITSKVVSRMEHLTNGKMLLTFPVMVEMSLNYSSLVFVQSIAAE